MAYSNFVNGFKVTTRSAIDQRILLSKAEMLSVSQNKIYLVPELYFALCTDDNKFYLYTKQDSLPWDPETGNYHPIECFLDFTAGAAQEKFEAAIGESETINNITEVLVGDETPENPGLITRVDTVEEKISNIKIDGGLVE